MKKFIAISLAVIMTLLSAAILAVPASAGEFITTHNLPAEYVELEYIECDGRSIINTGIKATTKTCYNVTFQVTNTTLGSTKAEKLAGFGGSGSYKGIIGFNYGGGGGGTGSPGRFQISHGVSDAVFSIALGGTANKDYQKDTAKHTLIMDAASAKATFDGVEVINLTDGTTLQDEKLGLIGIGGCNYTSSTSGWDDYQSLCAAKIFYVKITNDGATAGEFIPAYRVADQKVGMYDLVTKKFFENVHETVEKKEDEQGKEVEVGRYYVDFTMPADAVLVNPNAGTNTETNPPAAATGDNTIIILAAVAAVTLAGSVIIFRRRRVND